MQNNDQKTSSIEEQLRQMQQQVQFMQQTMNAVAQQQNQGNMAPAPVNNVPSSASASSSSSSSSSAPRVENRSVDSKIESYTRPSLKKLDDAVLASDTNVKVVRPVFTFTTKSRGDDNLTKELATRLKNDSSFVAFEMANGVKSAKTAASVFAEAISYRHIREVVLPIGSTNADALEKIFSLLNTQIHNVTHLTLTFVFSNMLKGSEKEARIAAVKAWLPKLAGKISQLDCLGVSTKGETDSESPQQLAAATPPTMDLYIRGKLVKAKANANEQKEGVSQQQVSSSQVNSSMAVNHTSAMNNSSVPVELKEDYVMVTPANLPISTSSARPANNGDDLKAPATDNAAQSSRASSSSSSSTVEAKSQPRVVVQESFTALLKALEQLSLTDQANTINQIGAHLMQRRQQVQQVIQSPQMMQQPGSVSLEQSQAVQGVAVTTMDDSEGVTSSRFSSSSSSSQAALSSQFSNVLGGGNSNRAANSNVNATASSVLTLLPANTNSSPNNRN